MPGQYGWKINLVKKCVIVLKDADIFKGECHTSKNFIATWGKNLFLIKEKKK